MIDYYERTEVSNSDLTELKNLLHPTFYNEKGSEDAFRFGSMVDAMVTEPWRVNFLEHTIDGNDCDEDEFLHAKELLCAIRKEAMYDSLLSRALEYADTQKVMINKAQKFNYCGLDFELDTRCKWDWYLTGFGGDLKTTSATSQSEFDEAFEYFDYDRSRSWYMDISGADKDFVYAVSKKNGKIFRHFVVRGDADYERGKEKYNELAFLWWCFKLN